MKIEQEILLREWQKKAFDRWKENSFRGIFSVVTGGGKTIFGIFCISWLFSRRIIDRVIIVVPTKTLQDQWAANIINLSAVSQKEISFDYRKLKKINVLVNLSAQKLDPSNNFAKSMLVLDECHRYGTVNNLKYLDFAYQSTIGLTATLERSSDDGVEKIIIPKVGPVIYEYDIKQALNDGVVENYEMKYLRTELSQSEESDFQVLSKRLNKLYSQFNSVRDSLERQSLKKKIELTSFKRRRLVNESEQRKYVATHLIINNPKRKKIIFCETVKQAEDIKSECKKRKLDTVIYHSKMPRKDRLYSLNSFHANHYNTLIGCKALDEGFDVPDIDFAIIVSQTKTKRQRIQRLGRTIRKKPGKLKPVIYTFYSIDDELMELKKEKFNYPFIEVEWLEIK